MIEIKLNNGFFKESHTLVLYDSIENLPIHLFSKMQKYQMIENGIGKNIGDLDTRLKSTIDYLKHDKNDKAIKELSNLRMLFYNSLQEVDPSHLSFCCMVQSIDGQPVVDYSEEYLERMRKRISE